MGDKNPFFNSGVNGIEKPNKPSCNKWHFSRPFLQEAYKNQSILAQAIKPVNPVEINEHNTSEAVKPYEKATQTGDVKTHQIELNDSKLHTGCFPNDKDIHRVNLSMSDNLPTKDVDQLLAKIPFNQYNCHYYVDKFLNLNYEPGFVTQGLNALSQAVYHENIGSPFSTDNTLLHYDYKIYQHAFALKNIKLQPGDIVCVIDPSKPRGQQEVHSAIVIGYDSHNNAILRQKLNESDPVVDMAAQHFDDKELGSNKQVKIYRKQH